MATVFGIKEKCAAISACAIDAKSRKMITAGLVWHLSIEKGQVVEISEATQVRFKCRPGTYHLTVKHHQHESHIADIEVKATEETALVLIVPDNIKPDFYHIEDESTFNSTTEYQRRQMEREGQAVFGKTANELSEPVSRDEAQARRNAMYGRRMGPKAHPLLQKPQFDGIDDKVSPAPDQNTEVQLELQKELQDQLAYNQSPKYQPPGTV